MIAITALPMKGCYRVPIPVRWWVADMGARNLTEIKHSLLSEVNIMLLISILYISSKNKYSLIIKLI